MGNTMIDPASQRVVTGQIVTIVTICLARRAPHASALRPSPRLCPSGQFGGARFARIPGV